MKLYIVQQGLGLVITTELYMCPYLGLLGLDYEKMS